MEGLEVNKCKTKHMEVRCHHTMLANEHIKVDCNSHNKVNTFGSIHYGGKCRLKEENSCYSVQTIFPSQLPS
jgi:hypothetical protein